MSNKYYFDKEIAYPFNLVYRLEYGEEKIENTDFLKELFDFNIFELDGRINGATHLLEEVKVGEPIDMSLIEEEDLHIFADIGEDYEDGAIFDENCQAITVKRLKALKTFRDSLEILRNMFYNKDIADLEKLVKENGR